MPVQQRRPDAGRPSWRSRPRKLTVFFAGMALFDIAIWTAVAFAR